MSDRHECSRKTVLADLVVDDHVALDVVIRDIRIIFIVHYVYTIQHICSVCVRIGVHYSQLLEVIKHLVYATSHVGKNKPDWDLVIDRI